MNKKLAIFATVIATFAFACQGADAKWRKHHVDKRLTAVSIGVGAASTATYFAINDWRWNWQAGSISQWGTIAGTTVGCMAVSPMIGTLVVDRPLTQHEAHYLIASCALPIVGGWLVNAAYDAHPEWEQGSKPAHWTKKRHAKKM